MAGVPLFIEPGKLPRRFRGGAQLSWVPGLLYALDRGSVFVDCAFYKFAEDPVIMRLMLAINLGKGVAAGPSPRINARVYEVGECPPISDEDILYVNRYIDSLLEGSGALVVRPARLLLSHILSPADWVLGDMRGGGVEGVTQRVMASILREKLEMMKKARGSSPVLAYILYGRAGDEVYVFFSGKALRNKLVEVITKRSSEAEKAFRP